MKLFKQRLNPPIYRMPARHRSFLPPDRLVRVLSAKSQKLYCLCEVKDLKIYADLMGLNLDDCLLEALDDRGNRVPIQDILQVKPFGFLKLLDGLKRRL